MTKILVLSVQHLRQDEPLQCPEDGDGVLDVEREVEEGVKGVGGLLALQTLDCGRGSEGVTM